MRNLLHVAIGTAGWRIKHRQVEEVLELSSSRELMLPVFIDPCRHRVREHRLRVFFDPPAINGKPNSKPFGKPPKSMLNQIRVAIDLRLWQALLVDAGHGITDQQ